MSGLWCFFCFADTGGFMGLGCGRVDGRLFGVSLWRCGSLRSGFFTGGRFYCVGTVRLEVYLRAYVHRPWVFLNTDTRRLLYTFVQRLQRFLYTGLVARTSSASSPEAQLRLFPRREGSQRRGGRGGEQYEGELEAPCPRGRRRLPDRRPWLLSILYPSEEIFMNNPY